MIMSVVEISLAIALGVALAAAVGLRVFVPVLVVSLAGYFGKLELSQGLAWMATGPAVATFAVAAVVEIAAYYIPGVDNILDVIASPLALIAGTLMVAAPLSDLPPVVKWTTAVIAGGGAAGITQGLSSMLRAKSTLATGGLGNSVIATGELGGALVLSLLALVMPVLALVLFVVGVYLLFRLLRRVTKKALPA
jgi:Domain of unknown function (DUF4126)